MKTLSARRRRWLLGPLLLVACRSEELAGTGAHQTNTAGAPGSGAGGTGAGQAGATPTAGASSTGGSSAAGGSATGGATSGAGGGVAGVGGMVAGSGGADGGTGGLASSGGSLQGGAAGVGGSTAGAGGALPGGAGGEGGEAGSGGVMCLSSGDGADAAGLESPACFTDSDCQPLRYCQDGKHAITHVQVCHGNSCDYTLDHSGYIVTDCAPGTTCLKGTCVASCASDEDCGEAAPFCMTGDRYQGTFTCQQGVCEATYQQASCAAGLRCYQGECLAPGHDGAPKVACTNALDCTIPAGLCVCGDTMRAYRSPACVEGLCTWETYEAFCNAGCVEGLCSLDLP